MHIGLIAQLAVAVSVARALLNATETSTSINLVNDRVTASIVKPGGRITVLKLDGVDILGPRSGNVGSVSPHLLWSQLTAYATTDVS